MIELKNIIPYRRQKANSLLGLSLDGSRLEGVWLRRTGDALQMQTSFAANLGLDPMSGSSELVGREIRNHLDAAEVRERRCVVALPLKWALSTSTQLPPLPEADVASFLAIEAERGFPCDPTTLITATSRCKSASGSETAMLIGMPRTHIAALEAVLRAAGLKPEGFSLGITALQPPTAEPVLALAIGERQIDLQITQGGGVRVLRTLEAAIDASGGQPKILPEVIAREVRITLGQLPDEMRTGLRQMHIFGPREGAELLAAELGRRFAPVGLEAVVISRHAPTESGLGLPAEAPVSSAFSMAAAGLSGEPAHLEFLPPRISAWQQFMSRYGQGKMRRVGLIAGGVVGLVVLGFLGQQFMLWRLQARWAGMKDQVLELEATQEQIKQYRPWFDESARSLSILKQLTLAFPEDGVVTAKTVEFREPNLVSCTGTARDNAALLRTLAELRKAGNVADLKVNRIQGKTPIQFTFDFRWVN